MRVPQAGNGSCKWFSGYGSDRVVEAGLDWIDEVKDYSFPVPFVYGSLLHLRQIILNILGNCLHGIERDESHGRVAFSLVTPSHLCYNT